MPKKELQQAIAWFENRLSSATMPGARKMFGMALSAIREKQERESQKPLTLDELREMSEQTNAAADLIESLTAQLTESQRKEKADAELIRKIYFATDEDLCDCCRKIVRMIEAWWNDDEKGEAE